MKINLYTVEKIEVYNRKAFVSRGQKHNLQYILASEHGAQVLRARIDFLKSKKSYILPLIELLADEKTLVVHNSLDQLPLDDLDWAFENLERALIDQLFGLQKPLLDGGKIYYPLYYMQDIAQFELTPDMPGYVIVAPNFNYDFITYIALNAKRYYQHENKFSLDSVVEPILLFQRNARGALMPMVVLPETLNRDLLNDMINPTQAISKMPVDFKPAPRILPLFNESMHELSKEGVRLFERKEYDKALEIFKNLLTKMHAVDSTLLKSEEIASVKYNIGSTLYVINQLENALPYLESAYRIRLDIFGADNPKTQKSLDKLQKCSDGLDSTVAAINETFEYMFYIDLQYEADVSKMEPYQIISENIYSVSARNFSMKQRKNSNTIDACFEFDVAIHQYHTQLIGLLCDMDIPFAFVNVNFFDDSGLIIIPDILSSADLISDYVANDINRLNDIELAEFIHSEKMFRESDDDTNKSSGKDIYHSIYSKAYIDRFFILMPPDSPYLYMDNPATEREKMQYKARQQERTTRCLSKYQERFDLLQNSARLQLKEGHTEINIEPQKKLSLNPHLLIPNYIMTPTYRKKLELGTMQMLFGSRESVVQTARANMKG